MTILEDTRTVVVVDRQEPPNNGSVIPPKQSPDDCSHITDSTDDAVSASEHPDSDADSTAMEEAVKPSDKQLATTMDDPDAKPTTQAPALTAIPADDTSSPTTASSEEHQNVTTQDHKGCTGVYSGGMKHVDGMLRPDGHGTMHYKDHPTVQSYTGHWTLGAWAGQGQAVLHNGDRFSGEHVQGQRQGSGTYHWADGRTYAGSFWKDQRHGQGSYTWPDGATYCGAYDRGVRTGYGKYIDPTDGVSYQGDWVNGKYHGYGILTTTVPSDDEDGQQQQSTSTDQPKRIYRGHFVNGQAHGQGVELSQDGTVRHDGEWNQGVAVGQDGLPLPVEAPQPEFTVVQNESVVDANGLRGTYRGILHVKSHSPHGNGVLKYSAFQATPTLDDQLDFYEGCFDMGRYEGRGRLHWKNGDSYDGDYVNGKRQGEGVYRWSDGRHYKGSFFNDLRHGFGKFVYGKHQSADWYEGEFVEGRREGKGRFLFSDGSRYEGEWKAGYYHGQGILVNGKQEGGTTYEGEFEQGVAHGQGKEISADGTVIYEGLFIRGESEPEAARKAQEAKQRFASETTTRQPRRDKESTTARGSPPEPDCEAVVDLEVQDAEGNKGQYTGLVRCSSRKPHGVGRMVYLDGRRIHEGFWKNGMKEGHGRCLFVEQGDFHEGEYSNNVRHGPGSYKWKDGRVFVGHYVNDLRNGKGVFTYPNGEQYEGDFFRGEKHGHGRFEFRGGFYLGEWEQGRYHGKGRLSVRGEELEGIFRDGEFVGKATCDVHADKESKETVDLVQEQLENVDLDSTEVGTEEVVPDVSEEAKTLNEPEKSDKSN